MCVCVYVCVCFCVYVSNVIMTVCMEGVVLDVCGDYAGPLE